jgi:hypothetical protein
MIDKQKLRTDSFTYVYLTSYIHIYKCKYTYVSLYLFLEPVFSYMYISDYMYIYSSINMWICMQGTYDIHVGMHSYICIHMNSCM